MKSRLIAVAFANSLGLAHMASEAVGQEPPCVLHRAGDNIHISKDLGGLIYIDQLASGDLACVSQRAKVEGSDWGLVAHKQDATGRSVTVNGWTAMASLVELAAAEAAYLAIPPAGVPAPAPSNAPAVAVTPLPRVPAPANEPTSLPPPAPYVSPPALPSASLAPPAGLSAPGAGIPPSSAHDGRYAASIAAGCGQPRQSVIIRIEQGAVTWRHDLQNIGYNWVGTVDAAGAIQASIPGNPTFRASGTLTDLTIEVHYPQCASGSLIMQIRGRVR